MEILGVHPLCSFQPMSETPGVEPEVLCHSEEPIWGAVQGFHPSLWYLWRSVGRLNPHTFPQDAHLHPQQAENVDLHPLSEVTGHPLLPTYGTEESGGKTGLNITSLITQHPNAHQATKTVWN